MKIYGKISHLYLFSKWEKLIWDFFYGKLYHSCNRTFSLGNGENFIDETGLRVVKLSFCQNDQPMGKSFWQITA